MEGIVSSSALVWFPNIPHALREWYRILRGGGWIAFSCFGGSARQTINEVVIDLLRPHGIAYPELTAPLNSPDKCRAMVETAGFVQVTVQTAQHQHFTTDPDASFVQAWGLPRRFNITLPPAELDTIKAQYRVRFQDLLMSQDRWNHDYEQFVVAYKPHGT
jgi:SAM-dependent methyltransferase